MKLTKVAIATSASLIALTSTSSLAASSIADALTKGKASADVNVRYETVSQDNSAKDADALTARIRAKYATGSINGFSAVVGLEASQSLIEDYNSSENGKTDYSLIKDPDHTELDQAFIQYKTDGLTVKLGRQIFTLDNHRFIGHVGWRQDMQTYDALSAVYKVNADITTTYAFINKRNTITETEVDASDHLLNLAYQSPVGKVVAYAYLLDDTMDTTLNTYGARFTGAPNLGQQKVNLTVELASQTKDTGAASMDASYFLVEAATKVSAVGLTAGYEVLGSDDGNYGFATPYATGHKFNGWSDQFLKTPANGLTDFYVGASGSVLGGKLAGTFHSFASAESVDADDLGSELNLVYTKKFAKKYLAGIKFAKYSAGDAEYKKVDTDKLWIWAQAKF